MLFVKARDAFEANGAKVGYDNSDVNNPVLTVEKDNIKVELPINKNIAYVNGTAVKLDGVVVFNGINVYVPQSAIDLIK